MTIKDRSSLASLRHAFSSGSDFGTARLQLVDGVLTLSAVDLAGVLMGRLSIRPEGYGENFEMDVDLSHFNGSLIAALHERAERERVIADFDFDGHSLEVKVTVADNKIYRRLLMRPPEPYRLPQIPALDDAACLTGLSASVLADAVAAMEGIDAEDLRVCSEPNLLKIIPKNLVDNASAEFPCESNGVGASTLVLSETLKRVGQFGFGHGCGAQRLNIAFENESFCKVEYELVQGRMTYWLAALIPED